MAPNRGVVSSRSVGRGRPSTRPIRTAVSAVAARCGLAPSAAALPSRRSGSEASSSLRTGFPQCVIAESTRVMSVAQHSSLTRRQRPGTSLWMLTGGEVFVALGAHDLGGTLSAEWANRTEREPRAAAEVTKSWSDNLPIRAI